MARSVRVAPLNVKKKKRFQKRFKLCFLCLQNGKSKQGFVHLADSQQYFSFEGLAGDLKSRINSWWLLVLRFFPRSLGACTCCGLHATQWRCPPASVKCPASKMKPHFTGRLPWLLLTLGYEQNAEHINVKKKKMCSLSLFLMYIHVCAPVRLILSQVYIQTRGKQDSIKLRLEFGYSFLFLNSVGRTWRKAISRYVPKSWKDFLSC